jgi:hypothetical protein
MSLGCGFYVTDLRRCEARAKSCRAGRARPGGEFKMASRSEAVFRLPR